MLEWVLRVVAWLIWGVLTMITLFVGGAVLMYFLGWLVYKIVERIGVWW